MSEKFDWYQTRMEALIDAIIDHLNGKYDGRLRPIEDIAKELKGLIEINKEKNEIK